MPRGTNLTERLPLRCGKIKLGLYNILGPGLGKNWAHKEENDDYQMNNQERKVCFFQDFYLGYFIEQLKAYYLNLYPGYDSLFSDSNNVVAQ